MPYIDPAARARIEAGEVPADAGELNYAITRLLLRYLAAHGLHYGVFNDIMGALEGAKLELYRRQTAPYEDDKRAGNGDVYPPITPPHDEPEA
jgi:hypothetical protein